MQFKDIVGQQVLINQLTEIIDSGRISHAQMFLGANGFGTFALAVAYAQYLNCQNRHHHTPAGEGEWITATGERTQLRADSCGECPSCKKYRELVHTDLHLFFPNATTTSVKKNPSSADFQQEFRQFMTENNQYASIDDWQNFLGTDNKATILNIRDAHDIIKTLSLKPYESQYKVVILWMAEKMNIECANTILKVLEEPMGDTLFLLVSESRERMLSTIISRTQLVKVDRIDTQSIIQAFNGQLGNVNPQTFAAASEGDLLQARHNLQQSETEQMFAGLFVNWMRQLFKINMKELSRCVDEIAAMNREMQKSFLLYCMDSMRACFLHSAAGIELTYKLQFGDPKFNGSFPNFINENDIERISNALNGTLFAIERNAYAKIAFMQLSFELSKALKKR